MVTYSGLRRPALLAKMASTVDVMSHGRLTLGIGSGYPALEAQFRAYGYDFPEIAVRSRQLREAIQILLAMWTQEEATFEGTYYQVRGAINQPKGVQRPHIPLLIGGNGEQVTLKLVAQYGDACHVFGDPATIARKFAVLKSTVRPPDATMRASSARPSRSVSSPIPMSRPRPSCLRP